MSPNESLPSTMAALLHQPPNGIPSLKHTTQQPMPVPDQGEALIKVRYASVIAPELYWPIYQDENGEYVGPTIPCHDFSGSIVACPGGEIAESTNVWVFTSYDPTKKIRRYQGAAANYAIADVASIQPIPSSIGLKEAATVPLSALTAWQAFHQYFELKSGMHVLVNGAAGPTGLWAVQVAKHLGAHVCGTASAEDGVKMLRGLPLPPDEIIDYKKHKIQDSGRQFDVVLDCVGGESIVAQAERLVKPGGYFLSICDPEIAQKTAGYDMNANFFIVRMLREQLAEVGRLIDAGKFKPVVDSVWPLEDGSKAFEYSIAGRAHGKVLIACQD